MRWRTYLAGLTLMTAAALSPARAADPLELDAMLPLTGVAAFVGQGARKVMLAEEKLINSEDGVHGRPVKFVFYDDQTSPQVAVQLMQRLRSQTVVFGPAITALCNALLPLVGEKGPVTYCFSPAVHPAPGSYMFGALITIDDVGPGVFSFFKAKGWTRIAMLFSTDASGQDTERAFNETLKRPEFAGLDVVAREHFAPNALSVAAQMEQIRSSGAQVVIGWGAGAPQVTVLKGYSQAGIDLPILIGQANLSQDFMVQNAAILPREFYLPSGLGTARGGQMNLDKGIADARATYFKALDAEGLPVENAGEVVWDPVNLVVAALRALPENASASDVRDYLAKVKGVAGISGIYDFTQRPQRGLSGTEVAIVRWNAPARQFEAVSEPGGKPLQ